MSRHLESQLPGQPLGTEFNGRAPQRVLDLNRQSVTKEQVASLLDAVHFLTEGHDAHAEKGCMHAIPCSRDYDPLPYPEALPTPEKEYAGTGIGFLYGLNEAPAYAAELAGWNVRSAS